ncbi:hypothetical protein SAMN05216276_107923 [Streptosporangium subroseum]|uniref:Uncharacterized protein n=1 Tax=Streptosporangium subroseum TaxID=106412 RepID=A0A239P365_9ACTN|nr:hypothetical protein [Streptosporangium subroseum]SNT60769.1 hypothetical protein SAMN05216276_107923 [Streptosporangium subroseum]
MKNIDEIKATVGPLARVEPGKPGGGSSGAGARTLLASITADEPGTVVAEPRRTRRYGPRRLVLGLAAAAVLATGVVVGPSLLEDGRGAASSYAVTKDPNGIVYITVRDFRDAAGLTERLRDLGVPAVVNYVPQGQKCREPRATPVTDIPPGLYHPPTNIPGEEHGPGWQMQINTKLFKPGQTFVWTMTTTSGGGSSTGTILMNDPVAPCVLVPDDTPAPKAVRPDARLATTKGRSLAGFRVDEKTVGEVVPEIRKRGLKVTYLIMAVAPGNPGGFGELRIQDTPVGDDWIVWEAEEVVRGAKETPTGVIRLLVTDRRYDRNPVYGGPRDDVVTD